MSYRSLCVLLLTVAPALAAGQGMGMGMPGGGGMGRHGGGGHRGGGGGDSTSAPPDPAAARDALEQLGFAGLLLKHKSDLQLTDSQVVVLSGLHGEFRAQTAVAKQELDSLHAANAEAIQTLAANHDTLTTVQRDSVIQRRKVIAGVLANIHDIEQQSRAHALALLSTTQQQQAEAIETQAEKGEGGPGFGGGRRGPGGGGGGGGRGGSFPGGE